MPGALCSVATCRSNSRKSKRMGVNLMFFRFPKDLKIQKEWVRRCAKKGEWNTDHKRLCSLHFKPDDYEDEMKARLMNTKPRKLKKDAIPSLFLPSMNPSRQTKTVKEEKEVFPDTPPTSEVYIQEQNLQQESKIPLQDTINEEFIKIEYLEEYKPTNDTKNDLSIEEIMSDQSELGFSTISSPGIVCKRSLSDEDGSFIEQSSSKRQKLNEAQEQPKKSSCELFLLSLVPHLESMTDHQQLSFQRQVLQLLEIIKYPQSDRP